MRKKLLGLPPLILLLVASMGTQETKRPTAEANDASTRAACTVGSVNEASAATPNFYDGSGEGTNSTDNEVCGPSDSSGDWSQRKFTTWQSASGSYSSLDLKIRWECSVPNDSLGECGLDYSTNGGSSWTAINSTQTTIAATTETVSLNPAQDLSQLQVRYCLGAVGDTTDGGSATITGYDIRTEGVLGGGRRSVVVTEVRRPAQEAAAQ